MNYEFYIELEARFCTRHIKNHEFVYLHAMTNKLFYMKEQTPRICMDAVRKNGLLLKSIRIHTYELYMAATKQRGYHLDCVKVGPHFYNSSHLYSFDNE